MIDKLLIVSSVLNLLLIPVIVVIPQIKAINFVRIIIFIL